MFCLMYCYVIVVISLHGKWRGVVVHIDSIVMLRGCDGTMLALQSETEV